MSYANLLLRPDYGKKAYRMRCRFRIGAYPRERLLEKAKIAAAEQFVDDMRGRGWEYVGRYGFTMRGPIVAIDPVTIRIVRQPSARAMLPMVQQGHKFRSDGGTQATAMPVIEESEYWEYELAGVFVHSTLLAEQPDRHEEIVHR